MFGQGILEWIGLLTTSISRYLGVMWHLKEIIILMNNSKSCDGMTIIISLTHINSLDVMSTSLNGIKNWTLHNIKNSLANLWQRTIQLSDFFPILIIAHSQTEASAWSWPNPPRESGTPSTIVSVVHDATVSITALGMCWVSCFFAKNWLTCGEKIVLCST